MNTRKQQRQKRHHRIRVKLVGTPSRPRLAIFRSNQYLYAECVDDENGKTLFTVKGEGKSQEDARKLGSLVAKKAKEKKITTVVFDRGGHLYHGSIKALADMVREQGVSV